MDKQHLADAWSNFQRRKKPNESAISDLVMRTWMRCRQCNMSPETPVYRILPESQFCQVRQKASGLIALVRNAISSFIIPEYGDLCNVVLVSSDGIVIYKHAAIARQNITSTKEGMAFRLDVPGVSAVSTCILEHTPVIFSGTEHYCKVFHGMYCHAMPLFDHHKNVIAILSISTNVQNKNKIPPFLPPLIANLIESQNNINKMRSEFGTVLSLVNDASIVLNQDYAVQYMNDQAKKLFGFGDRDSYSDKKPLSFALRHIKSLIESEGDFHRRPLKLDAKPGSAPHDVLISHKEIEDGRHVLNLSWQQGTKAVLIQCAGTSHHKGCLRKPSFYLKNAHS